MGVAIPEMHSEESSEINRHGYSVNNIPPVLRPVNCANEESIEMISVYKFRSQRPSEDSSEDLISVMVRLESIYSEEFIYNKENLKFRLKCFGFGDEFVNACLKLNIEDFSPDLWRKVAIIVTSTEIKKENSVLPDFWKKEQKSSIPNNSKQKENDFIPDFWRKKQKSSIPNNSKIKENTFFTIIFSLLMINVAVSAYETSSVGMVCSDTSDCTKYCGGHVICSMRQCNCVNGSLFDEDNYGCFKSIHDLHGQECCYDEDCRIDGAICREETKRRHVLKTCQCPEDHIFVENKCVEIKEKCSSKDDCEKHAHCVKLHHSINMGVCECNHGYIYSNGSCVKPLEVLQECVDETAPFCKTNEIYCKSERHNYGACKYDYKNKKSNFGEMCLTTEECFAEDKYSICKHGFCDCMPGYKNESGKCHPNLIGLPCSSKHKCLIPNTICDHEKKICKCENDSLFDGENCMSKNKEKRHCQEPDDTVKPPLGNELKPKSFIAHNEDRIQRSEFALLSNNAGKLSGTSTFISCLTCFWIVKKIKIYLL